MRFDTAMKLGQIGGALLLSAGVASCTMRGNPQSMSWLFIGGALLYAGCRLAAWLRRPD